MMILCSKLKGENMKCFKGNLERFEQILSNQSIAFMTKEVV